MDEVDNPMGFSRWLDRQALEKCGQSPYYDEWRASSDGVNFGSVLSTSSTYNRAITSSGTIYLRLKVTSSETSPALPTQSVYTHQVTANISGGYYRTIETVNNDIELVVFPNPSNMSTTVKFKLDKNSIVSLILTDLSGKIIWSDEDQHYIKGSHAF
ncbi:hypothetical protein [uncultured Imperialibacter sp.]|uniref:hypothetical protein n=1 Tax=Imperialibacter sp. TaxID=2038411 RepID=UPI0030D9AEE3